MTLRKATTRPRRAASASADAVPTTVAAFFEHGGTPPWDALLPPGHELMRERWGIWLADHPNASPPRGWEWIASPPPTTLHGRPYAEVIAAAREWARRLAVRR